MRHCYRRYLPGIPLDGSSSFVGGQRLNLHGKSDFSDVAFKDSFRFHIEGLFAFSWWQPAGPPVYFWNYPFDQEPGRMSIQISSAAYNITP